MESKTLWAACCLHFGSIDHAKTIFERYIHLARRDHWDVVVLGDLCDFGVPNSKHPETVWQQNLTPGEQIDKCVDMLLPIKRSIKAICGGNHADRIYRLTGVHPEKVIADLLRVPYVPNSHIFKWQGFNFFMAHGKGVSDISKVQLRHETIDCFLLGHTHQLEWRLVNHLVGYKQQRKNVWLGRSGCFLDDADYAKKALYQPSAIGSLLIQNENGRLQAKLGI